MPSFYSTGRIPRGFASGMNASPERAERAEVEQTFPTAQRKRSGRNTSPPWRGGSLFFILLIEDESVEKLFSERNFQILSEKNEEEEGILGLKSAAD